MKQKKDSSDVYDEYIKRAKKNAKAAMTDGAALKRWELGESQRKEKSNENERRSRRKKCVYLDTVHVGEVTDGFAPSQDRGQDDRARLWPRRVREPVD